MRNSFYTFILLASSTIFPSLTAQAGDLEVNFGAPSDLAIRYEGKDLSQNATQNNDIGAPLISIIGLNIDDKGNHDDRIEIQFAVTTSLDKLERLAAGYRFEPGGTLILKITSAKAILSTGDELTLSGKIISASSNNKATTFSANISENGLTLESTAHQSGRIRRVSSQFEVEIKSFQRGSATTRPNKETTKPISVETPKTEVPHTPTTDTLKLPRLFCDDMVLQQQTKNTFWGWAGAGEVITVKASWGASEQVTTDQNGKWKLFLKTPSHGIGHSLRIQGKTDVIVIENVAVGEVWLCAGQSNMGWSMGNSFESENETDVDLPNFRIFKSAREHWHEPLESQRDRLSQWKPCDPDSAAETSAVGYYFGKKLSEELDVPVGLIQQAFAGTPIEGWMPWEIQMDDPRALAHKKMYDESASRQEKAGTTKEKALHLWEKELRAYNDLLDAGNTMKNSIKPWTPPIITKPANLGHQYPAHQFNAMIHPIRPYGIRGIIWYQGERNSKNAAQAFHYRKQLTQLIQYYRSSWHERSGGNVAKDFPFQFTQLPSWTSAQSDPVEGIAAPWAINREAMRLVSNELPNTSMAVSIDTGDAIQLHPKNKKPIGIRHAYLALSQTYGKDFVVSGPRFQSQSIQGNQVVLSFDSIGSGLVAGRAGDIDAFAIAGSDQSWHWADATIDGDKVVVTSAAVANPTAVRYAWAMNPSQRNLLYNREGLPASPFRTDDWPLFDPEDEIVEVKKPAKPESKNSVDWERPVMTQ